MHNARLGQTMGMTMLGFEARAVIVQRVTFLARGEPGSQAEARRSVLKELYAAAEAAMMMASAAS